jgi:trigger factor
MQVTLQKLSPVLVEFDVQVGADRVKTEVDKAYVQVARSARVPGFRPGKAPRKVLSHLYGSKIQADVAQKLVEETFPKAVSEHQLQPVAQPAIETKKLIENEPFSYRVRVEILPKIESVEYEGLHAKRPKVTVTDEEIDKEVEGLRRAHSTLEPPPAARPSKASDVVSIDLAVEADGQPVSDASASDLTVEVGAGQLLPEIDEALLGKSVGETARTEVALSAQHPHPKLRGKTAVFSITLKDIKERVLPEVDDEFAKDVGDFETVSKLRDSLREKLEKQAKESVENQLAELLVAELVKKNPIPVPPSLVQQQMRITEQEILTRARSFGQKATAVGDELRRQIEQDSEIKVRAGLLMAEIAKKESIQIGQAELDEGLNDLAEQTGKNIAKLRAEYRDQKKREMLVGMILESKVLDIIQAKAQIQED